jgi:GNAT superfamily N-acetyltransferase
MTATIRLATPDDASAIAQVRVMSWRTTYRGMIPAAYLDGMKVEDSTALWTRVLSAAPNRTNTFVAESDGQVVGFASGLMLPEPKLGFDAELSAVYLEREYQRQGIGQRLVARVAAAQQAYGASGLIVWVIAGNKHARTFYERLGAELLVEQPFNWDGMDLVEAGYGWRDLDALVGSAPILH